MAEEEQKMSRNNRTADRVQALINFVGGESGIDAALNGELKLISSDVFKKIGGESGIAAIQRGEVRIVYERALELVSSGIRLEVPMEFSTKKEIQRLLNNNVIFETN